MMCLEIPCTALRVRIVRTSVRRLPAAWHSSSSRCGVSCHRHLPVRLLAYRTRCQRVFFCCRCHERRHGGARWDFRDDRRGGLRSRQIRVSNAIKVALITNDRYRACVGCSDGRSSKDNMDGKATTDSKCTITGNKTPLPKVHYSRELSGHRVRVPKYTTRGHVV